MSEVELKKPVKIHKTRLIWPGRSGWTFRYHIFIRPDLDKAHEQRLLSHELVHVEQFQEVGTVRFLVKYTGEYLVNLVKYRSHNKAYRNISYEVEARTRAKQNKYSHITGGL